MSEVEAADEWEYESEMLIQQAKEEGEKYGFIIGNINYSGFGSQGDGASWIGNINVPEYIEWKLSKCGDGEAIQGIPNVILETLYWMFCGGVFDYIVSVERARSSYVHENTMDLSDFYWTNAGTSGEVLGQGGGPFSDTTISSLLAATNWENPWEKEGGYGYGRTESGKDEYYRILWETILKDARGFAKDTYRRLEAAYDKLYLSVN